MLIGYARVSTADQNIDAQLSALKKAGCEKLYQDQTLQEAQSVCTHLPKR
jgi:DNA invertase Pin-like site-specific DNA recombinase